jgi:hypothetical protein
LGTDIKLITSADNSLIEFGDSFGFDTTFWLWKINLKI